MNDNEIKNRLERLERQVFGRTYDIEMQYRADNEVSDFVIAKIKFDLENLDPKGARYSFHKKLIQTKYGLNKADWSHCLNVIKAIREGRRPDFSDDVKPRAE